MRLAGRSVKLFKSTNPNIKCDLISVDGRHYHEGSVEDINSFQFLANPDFNLLFVDDTNCKARYCFDSAVEEHLRRGTVKVIDSFSDDRKDTVKEGERGFTILTYTRGRS
eukprot:SAG31_NODE_4909_length_2872_cov_8.516408_2_plen_110_part_00